ncbi:MAG TPA: hypothetical protein VMR18_03535 [Candidatus Saccharimonadales bacterium]|nr:hypothetical protein [Candidatus Saccharimonadales bacterium]
MPKTKKRAKTSKSKKHSKIVKHVKKLHRLTPKFVHGMVLGAFVGVLLVSFLRAGSTAQALSISSPVDCDANAVIDCGALSTGVLQQKYSNSGVATIYSYFGITSQDINTIGTTAVVGAVFKNGNVTVDGKTVATNAITAGRSNISPGSTKVVVGSVTFYKRAPSVSFEKNSLYAYVVMNSKKQFSFAILASCGNPVTATPLPVPKKPVPPPVKFQQPPPPPVKTTHKKPAGTTTTPITTASSVTSLPNTGPGDVLIIAVLAVIGGYVFHMTHRHLTQKRRSTIHHHRAKRSHASR